jgi:membrane-associated PAP2 superfamily phosphatase
MSERVSVALDWLIPVLILFGLTVVFWVTDLDLDLEKLFYDSSSGWVLKNNQPWDALHRYGVIPAWVVSISALAILVASIPRRRFVPRRRICAFLVLVMIVGPGLLVNEVFKKHWGRPRPRDVYEFAGDREYVPVWVKSPAANGNSFASGHASTGFYLFAPYFFLRYGRRRWAYFFLALGLAYGSLVGLARMIQGAHFFSDVVWAAGFVYLSGLAFSYTLRINPRMVTDPHGQMR